MHIADYCVTDTKSAIAVARALGRSYFTLKSVTEWQDRLTSEGSFILNTHKYYRDKESGLVILCGCNSMTCVHARETYLKHEEEKAKCVG